MCTQGGMDIGGVPDEQDAGDGGSQLSYYMGDHINPLSDLL